MPFRRVLGLTGTPVVGELLLVSELLLSLLLAMAGIQMGVGVCEWGEFGVWAQLDRATWSFDFLLRVLSVGKKCDDGCGKSRSDPVTAY